MLKLVRHLCPAILESPDHDPMLNKNDITELSEMFAFMQ